MWSRIMKRLLNLYIRYRIKKIDKNIIEGFTNYGTGYFEKLNSFVFNIMEFAPGIWAGLENHTVLLWDNKLQTNTILTIKKINFNEGSIEFKEEYDYLANNCEIRKVYYD